MLPKTLNSALLTVLTSRADPLQILRSTANVVRRAQLVSLDLKRVETVAQVLALRPVPVPAWDFEHHFFDNSARTVNYIFLLDTLNFSFWGEPKWSIQRVHSDLDGYWALATALKHAAIRDATFLDAEHLADISPDELSRVLRGKVEIPMFVERWRNVQELGRVLRDRFSGSAARLVEQANGNAATLARLVAHSISSFNDTTLYRGRAVNFFKRAQILAGDLYGSFGGEKWGMFKNMHDLTSFADYKLPQLLRAWGILKYAPALARRVDKKIPLAKDSPEEIEIRAGMIWGVELLRHALLNHDRVLNSVQMDWFLWETSQNEIKGMKPYHRVRTIYY
jgi:hypothetical protein